MSYLSVENFKFGLDTRKSQQTANPGTLVTGQNGQINQGGEFEVRKAFVLLGTLPRAIPLSVAVTAATNATPIVVTIANVVDLLTTDRVIISGVTGNAAANGSFIITRISGSQFSLNGSVGSGAYTGGGTVIFRGSSSLNAYGLQATNTGLVSFGSVDSLIPQTAGGLLYTFPTGVMYQRLRHYAESGKGWVVSVTGAYVMDSCIDSCSYAGKAYAICRYGLPDSFATKSLQIHYNGTPLDQASVGVTWADFATNAATHAVSLASMISSYLTGFTATAIGGATSPVEVSSPAGSSISLSATDNAGNLLTVSGTIPAAPNVPEVVPFATFDLRAWASGTTTLAVTDYLAIPVTLAAARTTSSSANFAAFVAKLCKDINDGGTGYSATFKLTTYNGGKVYRIAVYAPAGIGAEANTLSLTETVVAGTGGITVVNNTAFTTGVSAINNSQTPAKASFSATNWALGTTWTLTLTSQGISYTLGAGNIQLTSTGISPNFCMANANRVYMLAGGMFIFSKLGDARLWEDQDTGSGSVNVENRTADPQELVALTTYQGKIAVLSRNVVVIYNAPADPANFAVVQTLENTGTFARRSVQSVGDLDVMYLADTGIRSLRVRDASLNAYVADIGSPIDQLVQDALATAGTNQDACAVTEPSSVRYWLYLKGNIYVLSYFPNARIVAWSTYLPTYETLAAAIAAPANYVASMVTYVGLVVGTVYKLTFGANEVSAICGADALTTTGYFKARADTLTITGNAAAAAYTGTLQVATQNTFTPELFEVYQGQVYVLATDGKVFVYGGTNNTTYDSVIPTLEVSWLDAGKAGTLKQGLAVNAVYSGGWDVYAGMDMKGGTMDVASMIGSSNSPNSGQDSTVEGFKYPFQGSGTHFKLKAIGRPGSISSRRTFSRFIFHFNMANEKT